jgi:hypothetical protein
MIRQPAVVWWRVALRLISMVLNIEASINVCHQVLGQTTLTPASFPTNLNRLLPSWMDNLPNPTVLVPGECTWVPVAMFRGKEN